MNVYFVFVTHWSYWKCQGRFVSICIITIIKRHSGRALSPLQRSTMKIYDAEPNQVFHDKLVWKWINTGVSHPSDTERPWVKSWCCCYLKWSLNVSEWHKYLGNCKICTFQDWLVLYSQTCSCYSWRWCTAWWEFRHPQVVWHWFICIFFLTARTDSMKSCRDIQPHQITR